MDYSTDESKMVASKIKINEDDTERLLEAFVYETNKDKLHLIYYEIKIGE